YKDDEKVKDLLIQAKELKEQLTAVEEALYQTKNRSNQDPLNFPIRLTNKLGHLVSLVTMDDFPPTAQDLAVKNELSAKINAKLGEFDQLMNDKVKAFNKAFNDLQLNYLFTD
ncbi:MAG: glycosyl hydrolase, partial [Flavobacteriaceae bacterium]|nr:glycosyl hydrolase [Flavobacteriaceae bacterium]